MRMCASGDIFQAKLNELLSDINGIKTYIDDIIVLSKYIFENHIDQLILLFGRLSVADLKFIAPKCSF